MKPHWVFALQHAVVASRELTTQTAFDHIINGHMQAVNLDVVTDFSGKGIHQQHSSVGLTDTTLTHVEHGLLVELAGGGAVRAFHIVGIDFQEGLGINLGCGSQDDVGIVLLGIGLLRSRSYIYVAIEHRRSLIVDDTLETGVA